MRESENNTYLPDEPQTEGRSNWWLFMAMVARAMGHSFLLVALPPLGRLFGFQDLQTGILLSLGALGLLITAPVWGFFSETIGRKKILLIALGAASVACSLYGLLTQLGSAGLFVPGTLFASFMLARTFQAFGTSGMLPVAQAWIADTTSAENRVSGMGFIGAAFGLGSILGTTLLFLTARSGGPHAGFYALAAISMLAFWGCSLQLREPKKSESEQTADLKGIEWRSVWHCLLVTTCGVVVYGILQQTTGLRIQDDFGKEPLAAASRAGAIMTLMALSMVIAQGIVLRFLALRPNYTVCIGALVGAGALFLLVGDLTIIQFGICMAGVGFAMGLMLPANLAEMSLRTGNDSQGRIAGINGIGQGLGMVLGPTVGAALYQVSNQAPYLLGSVLLIIVIGLYLLRPRAVHK